MTKLPFLFQESNWEICSKMWTVVFLSCQRLTNGCGKSSAIMQGTYCLVLSEWHSYCFFDYLKNKTNRDWLLKCVVFLFLIQRRKPLRENSNGTFDATVRFNFSQLSPISSFCFLWRFYPPKETFFKYYYIKKWNFVYFFCVFFLQIEKDYAMAKAILGWTVDRRHIIV